MSSPLKHFDAPLFSAMTTVSAGSWHGSWSSPYMSMTVNILDQNVKLKLSVWMLNDAAGCLYISDGVVECRFTALPNDQLHFVEASNGIYKVLGICSFNQIIISFLSRSSFPLYEYKYRLCGDTKIFISAQLFCDTLSTMPCSPLLEADAWKYMQF